MLAHLGHSLRRVYFAGSCDSRSCTARARAVACLMGLLGVLMACGAPVPPAAPAPPPSAATNTASTGQPATEPSEQSTSSTTAILFERGALARKSDQVHVVPGTTVTLAVTSDVADDIHLHGYNSLAPTVPGGEARLQFDADRPGRYVAELEGRALPLVEFIIEPD